MLQAQVAALENRVAAIEAGSGEARAAHNAALQTVNLSATDVVVRSVTVTPTADGTLIATASGSMVRSNTNAFVGRCSLSLGTTLDAGTAAYAVVRDGGGLFDRQDFVATRGFDVSKNVPVTVRLVCDREVGSGGIVASSLTAVVAPN